MNILHIRGICFTLTSFLQEGESLRLKMRLLGFGSIFLVFLTLQKKANSACTSSVPQLPGLVLRSVKNNITARNSHITDGNLAEGWYNTETDNLAFRISMTKDGIPDLGQCGTQNPIFLDGNMPKLQEGKIQLLSACYVTWESNCAAKIDVKVRLCSGQTQYYLQPPPGISGFCFEPMARIAAPNYHIPGTPRVIPGLFYKPMQAKGKTHQIPNLEFTCQFQQDSRWYYHVEWYARIGHVDKVIKTFPLTKNLLDVKLNEEHLLNKSISLGTTVICTVAVAASTIGSTTKPAYSEPFFIGIKVLTPTAHVIQGGTGTIRLQQTVPFGCVHPGGSFCSTKISLYNVNQTYQCTVSNSAVAVRDTIHCGKDLTGITYENCTNGCQGFSSQPFTLTVQTKQQINYDMNRNFEVLLKTEELGVSHAIWKNYKISTAHVVVHENDAWKKKVCSLIADPELITFDGRMYWSSTTANTGEFLLYENTQYPIQVQYKTFPCRDASIGTCTCGVVIRAGGDLWMYNTCNNANFIGFVSCQDGVLKIEEMTNTHYKITTPIGTYIDVLMQSGNYLDVKIYSSPADQDNTIGHCGKLNDNSNDDIFMRGTSNIYTGRSTINSYFESWKLTSSENYFDRNNWNPPRWDIALMTCMCSYNNGLKSEVLCSNDLTATCQLKNANPVCNPRKRRSLQKSVRGIGRLLQEPQPTHASSTRNVRQVTYSNVTFSEAYTKCEEFFATKKVFALKDTVPDAKVNLSLESCANDGMIDITQTAWMNSHFESWALSIHNEIKRNITFQNTSRPAMEMFLSSHCPDECNNHGQCKNGTCVCDEGYAGSTCFINKADILSITDIEGDGLCDTRNDDDCHQCLLVKTEYLLSNFSCNIYAYEALTVNQTKTNYMKKKLQELLGFYNNYNDFKTFIRNGHRHVPPIPLIDKDGSDLKTYAYQNTGELENLFEGRCCPRLANRRKRTTQVPPVFVTKYMIAVSNDGVHYGPQRHVYVYDSTCQQYTKMQNGDLTFTLKRGNCYIDGYCYQRGQSYMSCSSMCLPEINQFGWSEGCNLISDQNSKNEEHHDDNLVLVVALTVTGLVVLGVTGFLVIWKHKRPVKTRAGIEDDKPPSYANMPSNKKFEGLGHLNQTFMAPQYSK